jgi:hypothetical protein
VVALRPRWRPSGRGKEGSLSLSRKLGVFVYVVSAVASESYLVSAVAFCSCVLLQDLKLGL